MRNGLLRRIAATVVAAGLVLINCTAAMAAETLTGGKVGSNTGTALEKSITFEKELVVFNPDVTTIAAPKITYTYTLTAGSADKQIKDDTGVMANTKAGILPATTTATVVFNNEDITAAAGGASNKSNITFDFSGVTFTAAGIYRYVITETTDVTKDKAGITDGGISDTRYLDVYVRDADTSASETARQIYGYVMFSADNDIDGTNASSVTAAGKTTGFVDDATNTADQYHTFNAEVSKTVVNDTAMSTHQFPFNVDFKNTAVTQSVKLGYTQVGSPAGTQPTTPGTLASLDVTNLKLAHGEKVKYIGIPEGTDIDVYETNDVTGTTYNSTYSVDGAAATGSKNITWESAGDANKSSTATIDTTAIANGDPADTVAHSAAFTNTLTLISPTGLAFRYAPYALLIFAAVLLMMVMNRRKEDARV